MQKSQRRRNLMHDRLVSKILLSMTNALDEVTTGAISTESAVLWSLFVDIGKTFAKMRNDKGVGAHAATLEDVLREILANNAVDEESLIKARAACQAIGLKFSLTPPAKMASIVQVVEIQVELKCLEDKRG